jgi:hypothetical protein
MSQREWKTPQIDWRVHEWNTPMTNEQHYLAFVTVYAALVAKYDGESDINGSPIMSPEAMAMNAEHYTRVIRHHFEDCDKQQASSSEVQSDQ